MSKRDIGYLRNLFEGLRSAQDRTGLARWAEAYGHTLLTDLAEMQTALEEISEWGQEIHAALDMHGRPIPTRPNEAADRIHTLREQLAGAEKRSEAKSETNLEIDLAAAVRARDEAQSQRGRLVRRVEDERSMRFMVEKEAVALRDFLPAIQTVLRECLATFETYLYPHHPAARDWDAPALCRHNLKAIDQLSLPQTSEASDRWRVMERAIRLWHDDSASEESVRDAMKAAWGIVENA